MQTHIVASFTNTAFKGNPAGVCILERPLGDDRMLEIAQELNLSETAFLEARHRPDSYSIRYFSPKKEIPLCGHATLASGKVMIELHQRCSVEFVNIQGISLSAKVADGQLEMKFPIYGTTPAAAPPELL